MESSNWFNLFDSVADVFADMVYKKIEPKIADYAVSEEKGPAFVVIALARKERYRKKIYEMIKGRRDQLATLAAQKKAGAEILLDFVNKPSDPEVFNKKDLHAAKPAAAEEDQAAPKPVAVVPKEKDNKSKGPATPSSTPGKNKTPQTTPGKKTPQKGKDEPKQGTKSVVMSPKAFTGPGSATKKSPKQQQKK